MVFEHIEKLKHEYTDKFVVVDDGRPELRRFSGLTGLVKTVNMNGNALVEFEGLNNIGWYDIEVDFLKVVDQPVPKEPASKPAKATAAPKKAPVKKPVKQIDFAHPNESNFKSTSPFGSNRLSKT